jgi:hypothetical protein
MTDTADTPRLHRLARPGLRERSAAPCERRVRDGLVSPRTTGLGGAAGVVIGLVAGVVAGWIAATRAAHA